MSTDLEKQNLEAHVDLCAERYKGLHDRLSAIETTLQHINEDMKTGQKSHSKTIIATAGTVIAGLLSTMVVLLMRRAMDYPVLLLLLRKQQQELFQI